MLIVLAELPLEIAVDIYQAAFQAGALQDSKAVITDARLYDLATVRVSPESSLQLCGGTLVRSAICRCDYSRSLLIPT